MHDNACGFGIDDINIDRLTEYSNAELDSSDFENCYTVDYILDARDNNVELLTYLASYPEYFGNHIDEIKVVVKNISLANVMAMGANKDSMKISYNGVDYVHFKDLDFVEEVMGNRGSNLTVLAHLNLNFWGGRKTVQCFIDDYEFEEEDKSHKYDF